MYSEDELRVKRFFCVLVIGYVGQTKKITVSFLLVFCLMTSHFTDTNSWPKDKRQKIDYLMGDLYAGPTCKTLL